MDGILEVLALGFLIGLTGALAPGPTLVATINSALKDGWTAGPKIVMGHVVVEAIVFFLIAFKLSKAASEHQSLIALVGGMALIIFGFLTIRGSTGDSLGFEVGGISGNPYIAGIVTSASNPYFWIWWLTAGSAMILDGLRGGILMAAMFVVGHWGADLGWYTVVSTSIDRGRTVLSGANYRRALIGCGLFLMLFGGYYVSTVLTPL